MLLVEDRLLRTTPYADASGVSKTGSALVVNVAVEASVLDLEFPGWPDL